VQRQGYHEHVVIRSSPHPKYLTCVSQERDLRYDARVVPRGLPYNHGLSYRARLRPPARPPARTAGDRRHVHRPGEGCDGALGGGVVQQL
jgi:hypothetical protein